MLMVEQGGININIVDGGAFFAHEVSANFTPTQLTLDFKCITPRIDPRGKGKPSFQMIHNVIMMEPWHAKEFVNMLKAVIERYEEEYGAIKKPAALEKAEKKQKAMKKEVNRGEGTPAYLG